MEFLNNIYFNIIDLIVISFILISCIVAFYRGLIKEIFSMICWVVALVTAYHLYQNMKIELGFYINQKIAIDVLSFGIPFIITLFISNLISKWLSPKFSLPGLLFFDKMGGFIFGAIRGIFFVILLYSGFIYLLGKEKNTTLPNILLEAKTYKYIKSSAVFAVNLFQIEEKLTDGIKKETQPLK